MTARRWAFEEPTHWAPWLPHVTLSQALDVTAHRLEGQGTALRLMLTGDAPPRDWFTAAAPGWVNLRVFPDHDLPAARYENLTTGAKVEVRRAAEWFGNGDYTHTDAAAAWQALRGLVSMANLPPVLLRSPGATGVRMWAMAAGDDAPAALDPDMQDLIRSTTPQHRIDLCPPAADMMPGLWVIDGRFMYAALLRELGQGPARMLTAAEATEHARDEYARARYLVRFDAGKDWPLLRLPGLLMTRAGDSPADGWHAPRAGVTWCDAAELQLAHRWGWHTEILEGIAYTKGRPLDTWGDRLMRARARASDGTYQEPIAGLLRNAVRAILLHTIGSFHSAGRSEMTVTASPMRRPTGDGWAAPDTLEDGRAVWRRNSVTTTPQALALRHPEWSAGVWGRAHARILENPTSDRGRHAGALYLDNPTDLVSIYGDAVMTTRRPQWAGLDDGKNGRLRVKAHLCGPLPWPRTSRERDELVRLATVAGPECTKGCNHGNAR